MIDDEYIDNLIAENLKRLLGEKDISQNKLAEMLDVPPPLINQIIQSRKGMGKDLMARICKALHVEPYEFYITDETPVVSDELEKEILKLYREARELGGAVAGIVRDELKTAQEEARQKSINCN